MDFKLQPQNIKFQNVSFTVSKNNRKYIQEPNLCCYIHVLQQMGWSFFVDFCFVSLIR